MLNKGAKGHQEQLPIASPGGVRVSNQLSTSQFLKKR